MLQGLSCNPHISYSIQLVLIYPHLLGIPIFLIKHIIYLKIIIKPPCSHHTEFRPNHLPPIYLIPNTHLPIVQYPKRVMSSLFKLHSLLSFHKPDLRASYSNVSAVPQKGTSLLGLDKIRLGTTFLNLPYPLHIPLYAPFFRPRVFKPYNISAKKVLL